MTTRAVIRNPTVSHLFLVEKWRKFIKFHRETRKEKAEQKELIVDSGGFSMCYICVEWVNETLY